MVNSTIALAIVTVYDTEWSGGTLTDPLHDTDELDEVLLLSPLAVLSSVPSVQELDEDPDQVLEMDALPDEPILSFCVAFTGLASFPICSPVSLWNDHPVVVVADPPALLESEFDLLVDLLVLISTVVS